MIVQLPLQLAQSTISKKLLPQELTSLSNQESNELEAPLTASSDFVSSLEGLYILVVDDQVDTREVFKFVLEHYQAKVLAVASASAAVAALKETPNLYDVLISDIGMPEEDRYGSIPLFIY